MELSDKEIGLVKSAIRERKSKHLVQLFLLVLMLITVLCMYLGYIDSKEFAYAAIALIIATISHNYHYKSASYDQLLDILSKRIPDNSIEGQVSSLQKEI
ncbi:hypothetical protein [Psychrosphaera haliotis]|uniref:Uncharacterized protein n=1 Tax=Psychrosphaera haliotis TaxID=555083 RepID=A0A6N8FG07_9GAMM|nr:hypothetical protein [Psychrosphaera haliotis]MUH73191.1 hypothetical protein [Psychrosphaera haliotis]